jgi:DNA invertase Pin-like site-specific DNA recombinase
MTTPHDRLVELENLKTGEDSGVAQKRGLDFEKLVRDLFLKQNMLSVTSILYFQIRSAFAEFERELIRERTIEGLYSAKKQGKSPGRPVGSKDCKKRKNPAI